MKQKTISIFASIGCQNVGDELILKNEIKLLKQEFGENTNFVVFTYNKNDIFERYENVKFKSYFPIGIGKAKNIFKNIKNLFSFLSVVIKSDFVVVGGGGIIFDKENQSTRSPLDLWVWRTKIFRFFHKKIYFFRLGIDIKEEENLEKLKKIFKRYYKIVVRDENSKNILNFIGVDSDIQKDPVFYDNGQEKFEKDYCLKKVKSYDFGAKDLEEFDLSGKTVGIAFRSGYLEQKSNISERMEEGKIREIIKFLQRKGAKIIFLPHSFHKTDEKANDYIFLQRFVEDGIKIEDSMKGVYEAYKEKKIDFCLSMRLHSMVLSQVYKIPYIGVSYSLKTELALKTAFID